MLLTIGIAIACFVAGFAAGAIVFRKNAAKIEAALTSVEAKVDAVKRA
jgi:zinc transporter ZupT